MGTPRHTRPVRRAARRTAPGPVATRLVATIATASAALLLAACDTGDGKTLQEPAVAFTTTLPPTVTLNSVPLDSVPLSTGTPVTVTLDPGAGATLPPAPTGFRLFAPWQDGAAIDARYTCDGDAASPAVSWTSAPEGTTELAVVLEDLTAVATGDPAIHWIVVGVDVDEPAVPEGAVPPGAVQGLNDLGSVGYAPPCPPAGEGAHTYRLTVYALNQQSELADGTPADNLLGFIEDVALGAASLTGSVDR